MIRRHADVAAMRGCAIAADAPRRAISRRCALLMRRVATLRAALR